MDFSVGTLTHTRIIPAPPPTPPLTVYTVLVKIKLRLITGLKNVFAAIQDSRNAVGMLRSTVLIDIGVFNKIQASRATLFRLNSKVESLSHKNNNAVARL